MQNLSGAVLQDPPEDPSSIPQTANFITRSLRILKNFLTFFSIPMVVVWVKKWGKFLVMKKLVTFSKK